MLLKKYNKIFLFFISLYFFTFLGNGIAADEYKLINDVFSNLSDRRQSSKFQLFGILGQSGPIGKSQNNIYSCFSGFHYGKIEISPPFCMIDVNEFEYQLTITAIVTELDIINTDNPGNLLGAFVDGQCRGFAKLNSTPHGNRFFLQAWSNSKNGEIINFKFYDSDSRTCIDINESVEFIPGESFGSIKEPHTFNLNNEEMDKKIGMNDAISILKKLSVGNKDKQNNVISILKILSDIN